MEIHNLINIAECVICKKKHQVRIQVRKKFGKGKAKYTNWEPVCSPECMINHPWITDATFQVEGITKEELDKVLGKHNTIEGQKNIIDVNWEE